MVFGVSPSLKLAAIALLASSTVPLAVSGDVIQVCVNKKTGAMRALVGSQVCRKVETLKVLGSGLQVLDINNQLIGTHVFSSCCQISSSAAIHDFNGTSVLLPIVLDGSSGFVDGYQQTHKLVFWHTTTDCSGQRYLLASAGAGISMLASAVIFQGKAYYPQLPYQFLPVASMETVPEGGDPTQPGSCQTSSMGSDTAMGPAQIGDVSTFVAPFHIAP